MKKLLILSIALLSIGVSAQKKAKIKGNREVLIKKFTIPKFTAIEIGEKFEVALQKTTDTTRVVIETDDNLFDVIHFSVENEVLKFYTSMDIVKKKRLRITVFVPENFHKIKLTEKGKVYNEEVLNLKSLYIEAIEKSQADLWLNIQQTLQIEATDKSQIKIDATTSAATIHLTENAELKGKLSVKDAGIDLDDHAYCKLEGAAKQLKLSVQTKAEYESTKFEVKEAVLTASEKTKVKINVSNSVVLKLSNESETTLLGNAKINLKTFKDNAALFKK